MPKELGQHQVHAITHPPRLGAIVCALIWNSGGAACSPSLLLLSSLFPPLPSTRSARWTVGAEGVAGNTIMEALVLLFV